jgi:hypothetical protein
MQNDAKLGLLAGVLGVIVAATITGKSPTAAGVPSATATNPSSSMKVEGKGNDVATPAALPAELGTTPALRTSDE